VCRVRRDSASLRFRSSTWIIIRRTSWSPARAGNLHDFWLPRRAGLPAADLLHLVLRVLGPIWPGRLTAGGVPLGDCGRHGAIPGDGPGGDIVPFHKLSQWLVYSLIEPLEDAGFSITGIDALTGLAEYRNGGLFLDCGALVVRDDDLVRRIVSGRDLDPSALRRELRGRNHYPNDSRGNRRVVICRLCGRVVQGVALACCW